MKLLGCVAFAMRPMKTHELADSVALILPPHRLDGQTKLSETVFGICKPLVEVMPDRTVHFVHFTVKEYARASCNHSILGTLTQNWQVPSFG